MGENRNLLPKVLSIFDRIRSKFTRNKDGKKQVYFNYHTGTNGLDGDAVSSTYYAYTLMRDIKNKETVEWTTLLKYAPDHCDDVYTWFITFTFK